MRGLEALGLDVVSLDTVGWAGLSRLARFVSSQVWATPSVVRMNAALVALAAKHRPDVVWIEKGTWVYPPVLRTLRRYARFLVHYNTDDVFGSAGRFRLARWGIPHFDLQLTTNRFNVQEFRSRFSVGTLRVGMGFDPALHRPPPPESAGLAPGAIVFLGHCEPHTEKYILALSSAGLPVRVWGGTWDRATTPGLRRIQPCSQDEYAPTIARAAVALCFLSRANRNESTGRSFEIPAIGGCMLAERTPEHEYLYREGAEAVFFSDAAELVRKARYLLDHQEERHRVARAGRARCLALDLSWGGHIAREWPLVERLLVGDRLRPGVDDAPFWPGFRAAEPFCGEPTETNDEAPGTAGSEVGSIVAPPAEFVGGKRAERA